MITTMMMIIVIICNFCTFDASGVRNDQKYHINIILMSRYKGQLHGGKMVKKFGQGSPPFFLQESIPN